MSEHPSDDTSGHLSRPARPDHLLELVRTVWQSRDPVPAGLVARMQAAAAVAATDWEQLELDVELMMLVERSDELAGTRGSASATAYTLRFARGGVDLLLRVTPDGTGSRIDGWVVPPAPMTVRVRAVVGDDPFAPDGSGPVVEAGESGRFELTGLTGGMIRLRLEPHDGTAAFLTPAFEI